MITHLSSEDYKEKIENKKVRNLDIREGYEFKEGHIKGAELAPSTRFDEALEELKVKKSEKVAIYCQSGSRSAFIAKKLSDNGYTVFNLELGLIDWKENGYKLVKK